MGIPFNDASDKWVNEICRCMSERKLSCGQAIDYLMAQKTTPQDEPLEEIVESSTLEEAIASASVPEPPKFQPDQTVSCPMCRAYMLYKDWPAHWRTHRV